MDKDQFVPPTLSEKYEFLYYVEAKDPIKQEVKWWYGFQLLQNLNVKKDKNLKKWKHKKAKSKSKNKTRKTASIVSVPTKVERKVL